MKKEKDIEDMKNWICINNQMAQCDYKYQDLDEEKKIIWEIYKSSTKLSNHS